MLFQFVLVPLALWWVFIGFAMWLASHKGRNWIWRMSGLGLCILAAIALQLLVQGAEPDVLFAYLDGVVLWLTLPIAAIGQALLTWWMLGRTW